MLGRIVAVDLVDDLGVGLERAKPMGKPFRDKQLIALGAVQHDRDMMAVSRRALPDIDRDIEDRTGGDPHQLGLARRRGLEMQPPHDAAIDRQGMVFLHERDIDAVFPQQLLAKNLRKKAARIDAADRPDLLHLGNGGGNDLHRAKSP